MRQGGKWPATRAVTGRRTAREPSAEHISCYGATRGGCGRQSRGRQPRPLLVRPPPDKKENIPMSWTNDDQANLNLLRGKELAGTLTDAEQGELGKLMARVEDEETAALAPEMKRLRDDVAAMPDKIREVEMENEELARLMAQQQALVADAGKFLGEFDRRRASILDGLARIAGGPLRAA